MIHELLLALSGHASPLLPNGPQNTGKSSLNDILSPAETALLTSLSRNLGQKHSNIRTKANDVVASHPSNVCRAVCASILSKHLVQFQQKILDVERSILDQDSSIVGAYNIVPLSSIVGAFDGWERKLKWLWDLVSRVRMDDVTKETGESKTEGLYTASGIIGFLRDATRTGYTDIEGLALDLVRVAETAWLKQLTSWLLYGKLPLTGAADFLISRSNQGAADSEARHNHIIRSDLVPSFVEPVTAASILFIGRSLNYLQAQPILRGEGNVVTNETSLSEARSHHLAELSSLTFPISPSQFTTAVRWIRLSLSKNALQKLLPLTRVLETLQLLKDFFLLERGEFALALISAADERLAEKQSNSMDKHKLRGPDTLSHIVIKEAEVNSILPRVWSTLATLQTLDDEDGDRGLELAREFMELSLESKPRNQKRSKYGQNLPLPPEKFQDLLLPTATVVSLRVQSPLDLFLTPAEVTTYSRIHSYLLAIRRAHIHLSKLMTLSTLRRDPKPLPANSASERVQAFNYQKRRTTERLRNLRPVWATVRSTAFLLAELGAYLQSEVIQSAWKEFQGWLNTGASALSRPQSRDTQPQAGFEASTSSHLNMPAKGTSMHAVASQHEEPLRDPERLMMAHQTFLASLCRSLLLDKSRFTDRLRALMTDIDHLCALMNRLQPVQQSADLEKDLQNTEVYTNSESEEVRLLREIASARRKMEAGLTALVGQLRDMDAPRATTNSPLGLEVPVSDDQFVPKVSGRLDSLLLKLDYTSTQTRASRGGDAELFGQSD